MTSIAASKGDVGAEMLASQIGSYFDLAIRIIEYHGGDVVKVSPCLSTSQCEFIYLFIRHGLTYVFVCLLVLLFV